jgi:acyl-CoA dehydrogenase
MSMDVGIPRTIFGAEHEQFRATVRQFLEREVVPHHPQWEEEGKTPREIWRRAGEVGLLGTSIPEEYGGSGAGFLFDAIVIEELGRHGLPAPAWDMHAHIVAPFVVHWGTEEQRRRWLPGMAAGEIISSIGLTEPQSGSDLQSLRTTAIRDGDHYVVNGSKTFITNGIIGDLVVLAVKTDPGARAKGVSLLLVEASLPGYKRGRILKKVGNKAQDTAELFFEDMRVPADCVLGEENDGWRILMHGLARERMVVAVRSMAICEAALEQTVAYTQSRSAFGGTLFDFQNTQFTLADAATGIAATRPFVDRCIELLAADELSPVTAAMAKLWTTELQDRILDDCVQLHGGYGYMWEYPITRAWADARAHRIYAGSNEVMRYMIGRSLKATGS